MPLVIQSLFLNYLTLELNVCPLFCQPQFHFNCSQLRLSVWVYIFPCPFPLPPLRSPVIVIYHFLELCHNAPLDQQLTLHEHVATVWSTCHPEVPPQESSLGKENKNNMQHKEPPLGGAKEGDQVAEWVAQSVAGGAACFWFLMRATFTQPRSVPARVAKITHIRIPSNFAPAYQNSRLILPSNGYTGRWSNCVLEEHNTF